jgi:hypothetical protein
MQTTLERRKTSSVRHHRELLKSRGEIEAAVCQGMSRFEQEYIGRGPTDISAI